MNTDAIPTATISSLFRFHGLLLPVVLHNGEEYIPIKPIVDVFKLNWKGAKRTLSHEENRDFHKFCLLNIPQLSHEGVARYPSHYCILLRTVEGYIFNIDRSNVRAQGNQEGYAFLRRIHEEWAQTLHDYETSGIAVKKDHLHTLKELMRLRKLASGTEAERLTILIAREMGTPLPAENHPQQPLFA